MRDNAPTKAEYLSSDQSHFRDLRIETTAKEGSRTVELSFSSDVPVRRYDYWDEQWYAEILDHSEQAVDLTRLSEIGVGLYNHDINYVVGRIDDVKLDTAKGRCFCRLTFDDDEASDVIFRKVQSGSLRGVSVGYRVYEWEEVRSGKRSEDGTVEGPAMIARLWEPYEISIVSCPADPTVGVGRSITKNNERNEAKVSKFREQVTELVRGYGAKTMSKKEFDKEIRALIEAVEPEEREEAQRFADDIRSAVAAEESAKQTREGQERERAAEISSICVRYGIDQARMTQYIKDGASVAEVCRDILNSGTIETKGVAVGSTVTVEKDERDKFRAAARDGLMMRTGSAPKKAAAGAEDFRGMRLLDLARECLIRNGESVRFNDSAEELTRRAFTTSDFPAIMTDLANVTLQAAYSEAPTTWQIWCGIASASDFKEMHKVRLGEMPTLDPVYEGGEYKMAELVDTKDSFSIGTFGKKFALTRQAIINDSLGAFTRVPQLFGNAAARTINSAVYSLLASNPVIAEDKKALFHANHSNLASTGSTLSVSALSDARVAMRRQKGLSNGTLNLTPQFLIVPPELETTARQILFSDTDISGTNPAVMNPFKNALTPVVDAELDTAAWYLAASPNAIDTVEVAFLNGQQSPVIEQQDGWNVDGIEYKVRLDFGVWAYDYRGLYKNEGSNE